MYFTPSNKSGNPEFGIGSSKIVGKSGLEEGKWYIVRVIINNNTAKLLINGQVIGSTKITTLPEQTFSPLTRCYIARDHSGNYFNGSMDYFRVYFREAEEPEYYYTGKEIILSEPTLLGDANCDGIVDDEDVSLIMKAVAFPSSYGVNGSNSLHITVQGLSNADVYEPGGGLTNQDARSISRYIEGVIKSLPES